MTLLSNKITFEDNAVIRQIAICALFGSVWGIFEMSVGAVMNLSRLPMTGSVLTLLGIIILTIARYFSPLPLTSIMTGVTCALLKMFSVGGALLGPIIGILLTSLIMEFFTTFSKDDAKSLFKAGRYASALMPVQGVIYTMVALGYTTGHNIYKASIIPIYLLFDLIGIPRGNLLINGHTLFLLWIMLYFAAGHLAVKAGIEIAENAKKRFILTANTSNVIK